MHMLIAIPKLDTLFSTCHCLHIIYFNSVFFATVFSSFSPVAPSKNNTSLKNPNSVPQHTWFVFSAFYFICNKRKKFLMYFILIFFRAHLLVLKHYDLSI